MIREELRKAIKIAVESAQKDGVLPNFSVPEVIVCLPPKGIISDYSTNIAFTISDLIKKSPLEIAQIIIPYIARQLDINEATVGQGFLQKNGIMVIGPGFINFHLLPDFFLRQVGEILKAKENFGKSAQSAQSAQGGQGRKVQIEFISANPTGPLTLGNGRGGFFGDVLANILSAAGYSVKREYFINDAGYQVELLGHSVLKDEKAQYKGEYIDKLNKKFVCWLCSKDPKRVGQKSAAYILKKFIQPTIGERMKIKFDEWVSERAIRESGRTDKILNLLREKNLIYEQDGATWFKSTQFGDDKDRVLITSAKDGREQAETYLLPDAAYHYKKFNEDKFDKVIDIWGADHHGYINRLQAAGKALGAWDESKLEIVIMQLVRLMKGGQEVKMSKRAGTYITLDELLEEIPLDVARFFFLMRAPNTHMDFDLDLAKEQSDKNPVYYVQYAYARLCSILNKAGKEQIANSKSQPGHSPLAISSTLLEHPSELALIKQLIRLPEIIEDIAADYGVHRLPQYSLDLVRSFHKFYEDCKVIDESNKDLTSARLALCEATRIVLFNTLSLMGISTPEKM